jgi:hypothetical protein
MRLSGRFDIPKFEKSVQVSRGLRKVNSKVPAAETARASAR